MLDAEIRAWRQLHESDACRCDHARGMHYQKPDEPSTGAQSDCDMKNCKCRSFHKRP